VDLPAKQGFSFAAHFSGGSSNSNCRACKPASQEDSAGMSVLEQVPDISLNLRPSILDDLGLEPASGGLHAVAMDCKSSFFLAPNRAYGHPDIGVGAGFKKFLMG